VRNPVDISMWGNIPLAPIEPRVLVVGRLDRLKAPEVALQAVGWCAQHVRNASVAFVGSSATDRSGRDYADRLRREAMERGIYCQVRTHGSRNGLLDEYRHARVILIASTFDNLPYSGLEAMASGRPVVTSNSCGISELLAGGGGSVTMDRSPRAFGEALLPYLEDVEFARVQGETARAVVREACDPQAIARTKERLFEETALIFRSRRNPPS
jgi:glycosyltransferase involved in cell wall biosynthesis